MNFIEKRLEESQVISLIIKKAEVTYGNLRFFYNVTNVPQTDTLNFDRYYIAKEILRSELGLVKDEKPGDIDILIIPADKKTIYFEYSSAFELKVVRPTNKNFRKNSNSLGTTQTYGLIRDGFPLVGLIHVCMNEPVNPVYLQHIPSFDNAAESFTYDPFPLYSIETQYQRLLKTDIPKYIGINVFGLGFDLNQNSGFIDSANFTNFNRGYFNPKVSFSTIEKIKFHFERFRNKYTEKVNNK